MQIITNQFQKELKQHGNEQFPFLVSYQKLSEYESGSFMWHWHPEIEITYVQKGTMCYKVNHMVYHLKEGDIVFNNSGALHSGTMEDQKDCSYIPVTFDPRLIYGFFQSTINSKYVDPVLQDSLLPALCINQSEPWHRPFREYLLRIIFPEGFHKVAVNGPKLFCFLFRQLSRHFFFHTFSILLITVLPS